MTFKHRARVITLVALYKPTKNRRFFFGERFFTFLPRLQLNRRLSHVSVNKALLTFVFIANFHM